MRAAKKLGIETIIEIGNWGEDDFFARAAADNQKRSEFINFLLDAVMKFSADGISIKWIWPGCPKVYYKI
jgi:GH18 family chitinase